MAITFNTNIQYVFNRSLGSTSPVIALMTNNAYGSMSIHSGVRPSAATIASSWSSYNASNSTFLGAYYCSTTPWGYTGSTTAQNNYYYTNYAAQGWSLSTATATNTGTATWAIFWSSLSSSLSAFSSTLPSTYFIVADVSTITGTGVVRMASTSFVQGAACPVFASAVINGTSP